MAINPVNFGPISTANYLLFTTMMIEVSLNGELTTIPAGNLLQALEAWHYSLDQSAVAINGEFIPRSTYNEVNLTAGDKIDVVGAVGGG